MPLGSGLDRNSSVESPLSVGETAGMFRSRGRVDSREA
jgi:hypothetical protein